MAKRTSETYSKKTLDLAAQIEGAQGAVPPPERYAKDGIAERREHVWRFLSRRVPQTVMAKLLKVSRRTIADDVRWWKERTGDYINKVKNDPTAANTDIGMTALRLDGIAQMAMSEAELARNAQEKNNFMRTAITAENSRSNLLVGTGTLPKAGEEIRVTHKINATFTAKLGQNSPLSVLDDPSSARKVLSAAEKILRLSAEKANLKMLEAKTIDVPATSKPADDE